MNELMNIHIEHYFPKGYNPDDEPWKSIKAHHNAALAAEKKVADLRLAVIKDDCETDSAIRELARPILGDYKVDGDSYGVPGLEDIVEDLIKLLAAGREKVEERKAANDVLRAENRGLFAKCEELEQANKKFEIVILEGEEAVDSALRDEVKQLRDEVKQLKQQLAAERELHKGYVEAMDTCVADAIEEFKSNHHNPIIAELNKQLAAEREKVKPLVELICEIAEESATQFKDERLKYHVIQMTAATWDKLQAKYDALAKEGKHE